MTAASGTYFLVCALFYWWAVEPVIMELLNPTKQVEVDADTADVKKEVEE